MTRYGREIQSLWMPMPWEKRLRDKLEDDAMPGYIKQFMELVIRERYLEGFIGVCQWQTSQE